MTGLSRTRSKIRSTALTVCCASAKLNEDPVTLFRCHTLRSREAPSQHVRTPERFDAVSSDHCSEASDDHHCSPTDSMTIHAEAKGHANTLKVGMQGKLPVMRDRTQLF